MSIRAAIHHLTHYKYDRPVSLGPQIIRLRPAPHSRTRVISHSLKVTPGRAFREPPAGPVRQLARPLRFPGARQRTEDRGRRRRRHDGLQSVRFLRRGERGDLAVRIWRGPQARSRHLPHARARGTALAGLSAARSTGRPSARSISSSTSTAGFRSEIDYLIRMEPGVQSPEETFERGSGSCRDSSWLLVQILRNLGFAARFVSGYLIQLKPDRVALDGPPGTDHDFTDLHAWARGLSARRRLDRPRSDLGPARRRKPHSARRDARIIATPRRFRAWRASPMSISPST